MKPGIDLTLNPDSPTGRAYLIGDYKNSLAYVRARADPVFTAVIDRRTQKTVILPSTARLEVRVNSENIIPIPPLLVF